MRYRALGQLKTPISPIGIGAMSFTDFYGETNTKKSHDILDAAIDLGINHIDTSDIYGSGLSEERIGLFIKANREAKKFFRIATKGGIERGSSGGTRFNNSKEYLTKCLENSLERLGVEQVELYYVHRREAGRSIEEVTETLQSLVKSGKTKQIGFSEISPNSLALASSVFPVAAVQSEYSLSTRYPELGLIQRTKQLGASLVAFSPVGRSLLTDAPHDESKVKVMQFLRENPRFVEPNLSRNIRATESFRSLARQMGLSAAALAISWLLNKDSHILPIPGTRSVDRLKSMADGVSRKLSKADITEIEKTLPLGWAYGDRYSTNQWIGPEKYC